MTDLRIDINFDEVLTKYADKQKSVFEDLRMGVKSLQASVHAHVLEEANVKLHSRREQFVEALKVEQIDDNTWVMTIPAKVRWIEDGLPEGSMLPALLRSAKAKTSKDGHRYVIVPFKHNSVSRRQGSSPSAQMATKLNKMIRSELKKRGVGYQKIDRNANGSPKLGLLHSFDFGGPKKAHWTSPALDGIRIYQSEVTDKKGKKSIQRDVMTFRVASSKHFGLKWERPAMEGMGFLQSAHAFAVREWEQNILPSIIQKHQ